MRIVWDEPKRQSNLDKHGLDFADLRRTFFDQATFVPTKLGRLLAISEFRGKPVTVVCSPLGSESIAVISMRPASRKERRYAP